MIAVIAHLASKVLHTCNLPDTGFVHKAGPLMNVDGFLHPNSKQLAVTAEC